MGRIAASDQITIVGESERVTSLSALVDSTFPIRLPAKAGDLVGIYAPLDDTRCAVTGDPGQTAIRIDSDEDVAVGQTRPTEPVISNVVVNMSATVEPDTDRDGFGDESQDACPAFAGDTNGCDRTAPETTIGKRPKQRTAKRRATFEFA